MSDIKPRPKAVKLPEDTSALIESRLGGPLSQEELAERWNTSQASVSRWLRGKNRMPRENAEDLAGIVGIPLDELLRSQRTEPAGAQADTLGNEVIRRLAAALGITPVNHNSGALAALAFTPSFDHAYAAP